MDLERLLMSVQIMTLIALGIFGVIITVAILKWTSAEEAPWWRTLLGILYAIIFLVSIIYFILGAEA